MDQQRSEQIRALNDQFRKTFVGGVVTVTRSIEELGSDVKCRVLQRVRGFDEFWKDNDPFGEHDFGIFRVNGEVFYFKIDYYDKDMEHGSEDPSDPEKTTRVLTVAYMSEY
jgi:Protein of unknown function (DUF3768)